jgi:hypothetical protein
LLATVVIGEISFLGTPSDELRYGEGDVSVASRHDPEDTGSTPRFKMARDWIKLKSSVDFRITTSSHV